MSARGTIVGCVTLLHAWLAVSVPNVTLAKPVRGNAASTADTNPEQSAEDEFRQGGMALVVGIALYVNEGRGFDLFSRDDFTSALRGGVEIDIYTFSESYTLGLDLGGARERIQSKGVLAGQSNTVWRRHSFYGGANLRYHLQPWLLAHCRVWGGIARIKKRIRFLETDTVYHDRWTDSPVGGVGAGVTLQSPPWPMTWIFGFRLEVGIEVGPSVTFIPRVKDPGEHAIDTRFATAVDGINLTAPYALASVVVRP
jgi:hypothetical protein